MTIVEGKSSHSGELVAFSGGFSHGSKDSIEPPCLAIVPNTQ